MTRAVDLSPRLVWLALALVLGWAIATQPIIVVLIGLVALTYALLSVITPIAALIILLVVAPLRTLIATEAAWPLPLDIGQLALVVFLLVLLLQYLVAHRSLPKLIWTPLYLPLLIFIAVGGLSVLNATSVSAWFREWLKWLQILLLVGIVLIIAPGKRWQWLVFGLGMAGLANALIGLYEFLGGSGAIHLLINNRFFRAFGTFGQPNPFGGFMGLLAPIIMMAALGYAVLWWRRRTWMDAVLAAVYAGIGTFLLLGIVISWSRGAWLATAAAGFVMFLALPRRFWQGLLLTSVLAALALTLWFTGLLPTSIVARITSSTQDYLTYQDMRGIDITPENYPVAERLAHWQAALNMAQSRPWVGVGLGNYEVVYPDYRLINWPEALGHAHNYYLNILAEGGLIGFLGYGKAWLLIMWLIWRVRNHPDMQSRLLGIGILGTWTYLAVHSLFDNLYVNNIFIQLGLILGILAVLYKQAHTSIRLRTA